MVQLDIQDLSEGLLKEFPDTTFFKTGPASKEAKTNVVGRTSDGKYLKGFTQAGKTVGEKECSLIEKFNQFSKDNKCSFSGPTILEKGEILGGCFYFLMEDAKSGGMDQLIFSDMSINELVEFYKKYRLVFSKFEKFLGVESKTEESTSFIKNKYKNKANTRISNGQENVQLYIDFDKERILDCLENLLSKVKKFEFEYTFGRLWTNHVFSDGINYTLIDFDNIGYHVKGSEILGVVWSNLLLSVERYDSFDSRENEYNKRYTKIGKIYGDKNLVSLLFFLKLIGTIFEDYGHLIYENETLDDARKLIIRHGIEWNYHVLEKLMMN